MAKPLHAGLAVRGGMAAAMLARDGFVGAPDLIEDPHGYAHAFSGGKPGDYAALAAKIGKPLEILDPGLAFKIFPSNFHTQAGVVAVLQMMREDGVKGDDVDSVRCLTNHMTQHSLWNDNPQTGLEGKLSLHYCLAAALVDGQLEVEQFYENRAQDPKIRALFKRITLEPHPSMANLDFTKGKDFLGMEVIIKLKNGKTVSRHIKSGFSVPAVDGDHVHADLIDKFVRNAKRVLPQANIDDCLARIKRLETFAALDDFQAPLRHRAALSK
jgi:2-methylcitrate dehydratase PrpD